MSLNIVAIIVPIVIVMIIMIAVIAIVAVGRRKYNMLRLTNSATIGINNSGIYQKIIH